jgi:AmmeMemoRadiSam system protein B
MKPKLREVQMHLMQQSGQQGVLLRDPLRLSDQAVFIPLSLAPLLELCDGTRDEAGIRASLAVRAGIQLGSTTLGRILARLDEALLLDNERFAETYDTTLRDFRRAAFRSSVLAGESYPADPEALEETLRTHLDAVDESGQQEDAIQGGIRGLVSPHIDFDRGGAVYAQVWQKATQAVREAEVAIIFGTDHVGGEAKLTFTQQRYATPWGALPTANGIVDLVARELGPEVVFCEELHHCGEHSIELAAIWLHYLLGDKQCELVPVLCGTFQQFTEGEGDPGEDTEISATLDVLKRATASHKTIVIAAGDLAHVGPAFGDSYAIDLVERARLKVADEGLMTSICSGDGEAFFQQVKEDRDRRRICGLPPIYMALRLLGETEGVVTGYAQCPADQRGMSFVSVCGILLS